MGVPVRRLLAVVAAAAALAGLSAPPAGAAAAADKVLTGRLLGVDGRAVGALLGVDLRDDLGRTLGASGCVRSPSCPVEGYAVTRRLNFDLGAAGSADTGRHAVEWSVALPPQTARVYVEAYPQGPGYAGTDLSRYAPSFRRNLPVPYGARVELRLPLVGCPPGPSGGRVGFVNGYARTRDGRPVRLRRITAYSMEPDSNRLTPVLGLGVGTVAPNGYYRVAALASGSPAGPRAGPPRGQRYQLIATAVDGRVQRVFNTVVRDCRGTAVNIAF